MSKIDCSVYLVTDRGLARGRNIVEVVQNAVDGGATVVQFREKNANTREMIDMASEMVKITRAKGIPFIVNDRIDVALAVGADGVHVGQEDMPAKMVRKLMGPSIILGVSTHNVEEAKSAVRDGADYIGVGSVFPTSSKDNTGKAIGESGLASIATTVTIPVVAIGGIGIESAGRCIRSGADGVAVISAIVSADDPQAATRKLKAEIQKAMKQS